MTDTAVRPNDVCPESRDSDLVTGFQLAVETLSITPEHEAMLASRPEFTTGWEVGVEGKLWDDQGMALGTNLDDAVGRKAWLVGFIAGQSARSNNYNTPFCVVSEHGSECDEYITHPAN